MSININLLFPHLSILKMYQIIVLDILCKVLYVLGRYFEVIGSRFGMV